MRNIVDYAETYFKKIEESGFNQVDSLVLSQLSYVFYDDVCPGIGQKGDSIEFLSVLKAEKYSGMFENVRDIKNNKRLIYAVAASPRFRGMRISNYVNTINVNEEKQFSAMVFTLTNNTAYIVFRGTDSTFVGWKEDFNMSFKTPVAAQIESVDYVNKVALGIKGEIIIGGHSKGGNLAVYAGINCNKKIQKRIASIYNHDGPGLRKEIFNNANYQNMNEKINKTIPRSSIIGMLLENHGSHSVVQSKAIGIMQHDPFSWEVGENDFIYTDSITRSAEYVNSTISNWISTISDDKRELFVDTMYGIIVAGGIKTLNELSIAWFKSAQAGIGEIKNIDPETRKFLLKTIKELVSVSMKNLRTVPRKRPSGKKLKTTG